MLVSSVIPWATSRNIIASDQIKRRQYPVKLADYADRLLLVGINYDRETKAHSCRIE